MSDNSKLQTVNYGSKRQAIMALNIETENDDDDSERRNWEAMMTLNVETEKWWRVWT